MPKNSLNVSLKGADDIFSTEESRQEQQREQVQQIPIGELFPFKEHPFKVLDDEAMTRTVESIAQYGVLAPLIARPRPDGDGYEIISGHRRQYAAKLAGLDTLPVIVRQMSDDAAVILMVDSNLQREHILPSERAFAYKMKLDAMKRTSGRPSKENVSPIGTQKRSDQIMAEELGESRNQIQRFIRLTKVACKTGLRLYQAGIHLWQVPHRLLHGKGRTEVPAGSQRLHTGSGRYRLFPGCTHRARCEAPARAGAGTADRISVRCGLCDSDGRHHRGAAKCQHTAGVWHSTGRGQSCRCAGAVFALPCGA